MKRTKYKIKAELVLVAGKIHHYIFHWQCRLCGVSDEWIGMERGSEARARNEFWSHLRDFHRVDPKLATIEVMW